MLEVVLVERAADRFEIPGVSNERAVRFWFCFYVPIRIAWHVRASSLAVFGGTMMYIKAMVVLNPHVGRPVTIRGTNKAVICGGVCGRHL